MPENTGTMGMLPSQASVLPYTHGLIGVNVPLDDRLSTILWVSIGLLALVIVIGRTAQMANAHLRHLINLDSNKSQDYWLEDSTFIWPWLKIHLLYAPLWKKRHNKEIQLSRALNVGTLPSRLHMAILVIYLTSNVIFCTYLDYSRPKPAVLAELRGRTGHLSIMNMLPLIVLAGRNNPFIWMLRVSFDTYNLFHRWTGRVVIIEAIVHTIAWAVNEVGAKGSNGPSEGLKSSPFLAYGMAGTAAFAALLLQSPSIIRHAFYETFLHIHQLLAMMAFVGVWMHCHLGDLPSSSYVKWTIALWVLERLFRFARIIYRNVSRRRGLTRVTVEALPSDDTGTEACRLSIDLARPWSYVPGTHAYIYIPSLSLWMNHPFSIAWSDSRPTPYLALEADQLPTSKSELDNPEPARTTTTIYMIIAKRTGMTASLYNRARASPTGTINLSGLVEGPYGGLDSLRSYGTAILFAAGIGITHQLGHVRDLLLRQPNSNPSGNTTIATRRALLVWSIKTTSTLEWVRPWMDEILALPGRKQFLRVMIFVTRPRSAKEVRSRSERVLMFPGRCDAGTILKEEMQRREGAVGVTVCGPGAFADEVRGAVRGLGVGGGVVDFVEEGFTW